MNTPDKRVQVGVAAIVIYEGQLLMQLRQGSHGSGTWSVPGGHQEFGEMPEQTAVREVLEETGVSVRAVRRLSYLNHYLPADEKHYVTLFIECEHVDGEPVVTEPDRCPEVGWVHPKKLRELELFPLTSEYLFGLGKAEINLL
jgi:8-oxo-dGTP diphosphatase